MTPAAGSGRSRATSLVRNASDRAVLDAVMTEGTVTRASLATLTGLSKPTTSASVARLMEAGILTETGDVTHGRGRSGVLLTWAQPAYGLAMWVAPDGVRAHVVDVSGEVRNTAQRDATGTISDVVRAVADELRTDQPWTYAMVSVADPIDRTTGRAVPLPDEPFLVGELDAKALLAPYVSEADPERVVVDNDVNWAVRAYARAHPEQAGAAVMYLGHGLGCGVVESGTVVRGQHGLAGEVAHLWVPGPDGTACRAIDALTQLGWRDDSALDVARINREARESETAQHRALTDVVAALIAALVGIVDPGVVVLAGPWAEVVAESVQTQVAQDVRGVTVELADEIVDLTRDGVLGEVTRAVRQDALQRVTT